MLDALSTHIAIVDDDHSVRRAIARLLVAYSFEVETFVSGREFIGSLKFRQPACLILDLHLRYQMPGLHVLRHLSGAGFSIPTVVVTAFEEPGIQHRCMLAGAAGFCRKPFSANVLLETIRSVVAERKIVGALR
jgi:FixJ family two-component response regulator